MQKERIQVEPVVFHQDNADDKATKDKMFIYFTLLHTYPDMNKNGVTYDIARTQEKHDTILNGYINFEHDSILNVGTIIDSNFIEEGQGGKIENKAVLWKSVLQDLGIRVEDISRGMYQMSMEVLYKDYYYMVGEERYEAEDNEYLEDYKGSTYEGKVVKKVLYPHEFTGAALTSNAADNKADIFKAVASKYKELKEGEDMSDQNNKNNDSELDNQDVLEDNLEEGASEDMPYKKFETEEEFNEFKNELSETIKEEVAEEIKESHANEVIEKFEELEIAEAESIDDVVEGVKSIVQEYKDFKEEVAKEKLLNKRMKELASFDIDINEVAEDKEEIANMSDTQFDLLKKTVSSSIEKAKASKTNKEEGENKPPFDPNMNLNDEDEDYSVEDIVRGL